MPKKKEKQSSHRHHKSKSWRGVVDYSSSEEKDFERYLHSQNYSLTLMESDGNCLFRAIAHQIEGNQESHDFYRQRVMDYISLHKDHFQLFIEPKEEGEEEEGMEEYIERLRRLGEWGGQPELFAATQSDLSRQSSDLSFGSERRRKEEWKKFSEASSAFLSWKLPL